MNYSIIVPVYNRPDEVDELLQSLCQQTVKDFEVIVVEDGSTVTCRMSATSTRTSFIFITMPSPTAAQARVATTGQSVPTASGLSFSTLTLSCQKTICPPSITIFNPQTSTLNPQLSILNVSAALTQLIPHSHPYRRPSATR